MKWVQDSAKTSSSELTPDEAQEQELLDQRVLRIYHENDRIYGAGKIHYLLSQKYLNYRRISIKRVQKSMKRQRIQSITIKKFKAGTSSKTILKNYHNLLKQGFSTIMDLHSRKIIGYPFDQQMTTKIVEKALDDALLNRTIGDRLIFHTDLGSQYTSNEYEEKLKNLGIRHSYIRKGCPYDNAEI